MVDCANASTSIMAFIIMNLLTGMNYAELMNLSVHRIVWIILAKILFASACYILLKYKIKNIIMGKEEILLLTLPVVAELSQMEVLDLLSLANDLKMNIVIFATATSLITIMAYYTLISLNRRMQTTIEYNLLLKRYEDDKKHASELQGLYNRIYSLRHDMNNHLLILSRLIKKEPQKADEYIQNIMKIDINGNVDKIETDSECFNAIANVKLADCKNNGINLDINIERGALGKLSDINIGVIFGNLFDNAIRAAKASIEKTILLDIKIMNENTCIIMKNSANKKDLKNINIFKTTKPDPENHGYGIKNIRKVVGSCGGHIRYFTEGNFACCIIMI